MRLKGKVAVVTGAAMGIGAVKLIVPSLVRVTGQTAFNPADPLVMELPTVTFNVLLSSVMVPMECVTPPPEPAVSRSTTSTAMCRRKPTSSS